MDDQNGKEWETRLDGAASSEIDEQWQEIARAEDAGAKLEESRSKRTKENSLFNSGNLALVGGVVGVLGNLYFPLFAGFLVLPGAALVFACELYEESNVQRLPGWIKPSVFILGILFISTAVICNFLSMWSLYSSFD